MRIVVASAHYPPNFVSGGTLAPQRIARGLRARGHDVSVYAGWLGDRPPLETRTEYDDQGMAVRWIVTTPWTAWSDTKNFDNLDVTSDFRSHLAEVRPDLVHAHSLQTLGIGIITAAAEAGARVAVTMHDFWWICARQFLCDRDLKPCSLVVTCGMCHCQVNRDWLNERNIRLASALRAADIVMSVSESSGRVLRANGIGLDAGGPQLVVDENGLDSIPPPGAPRCESPTITFLYTGGHDAMKGAAVLLDAARHLRSVPGWVLNAYGIEPFITETNAVVDRGHVRVAPPFSPDQTDAIFDCADVLVVPSVVRESHSLVTREALARGMPVITGDTLGPEEVVRHNENGLIVRAGDAAALARAMRIMVEDRSTARRLAAGARSPISIRHVDDQLDGLDRAFHALVATTRSEAAVPGTGREIRRVLFLVGIDGAPLRYRAYFAAEALGLMGATASVRHYRSPEAPGLAALADAVVVYRVPATRQVLALIEATRGHDIPVFFDVDDLIFDPAIAKTIPALATMAPEHVALYFEGVRRYRTTLEACDAFIGSTDALVDYVRDVVGIEAHRWANGIGVGPARISDMAVARPRQPGPLRVGYLSGTNTHDADWLHIEAGVIGALRRHPDAELWLGGHLTPSPAIAALGARVHRLPMKPWWELPYLLRDVDINLAPLEPQSRFNEAKSAIKWLEAALVETPTIASPSAPFREVIHHDENGYLADNADEFQSAITDLLHQEAARDRMGARARRDALLEWSPHLQGRRYLDILERGNLGRLKDSTWTEPAVHDEPWLDVPLEAYVVPDPRDMLPAAGLAARGPTPDREGLIDRVRARAARAVSAARAAASRSPHIGR